MRLLLSAAIYRPRKIWTNSNKSTEPEPENTSQRSKCDSLRKAFGIPDLYTNFHFLSTIFTISTLSMAIFGSGLFLIARAEGANIDKSKAALLMSCVGIGGVVGRLGQGILIDRKCITMIRLFTLTIVTVTIEIFFIPVSDNYAVLVILSLLFGISSGVLSPLTMVVPREVVRSSPDLTTPAIGLSMLVATAGQSIGGLIAGKNFDIYIFC